MTLDSGRHLKIPGIGALILLAAVTLSARPTFAAVEPSTAALHGISLLHQGRFDAATEIFGEISRGHPTDPEGPFFEAFVSWWKLLDRPRDKEAQAKFTDSLQEAIRRGEALLDGDHAQRGRLFAGTALILSAQGRAFAGSHLAAGSAAREGYRYLEAALEADPNFADAWFALGAYKYFAARMPVLVKALSFFFRIPRGDAEAGLAGLRTAEMEGHYFRVEASLLLTHIYTDEDENDLRLALDHLKIARALEPQSPLLAAVDGRLQFTLGRLSAAETVLRESLDLSGAAPGVTPTIPALARVRLALALYYDYRPRESATELTSLLQAGPELPEGVPDAVRSLSQRLRIDLADPTLLADPVSHGDEGPIAPVLRVTAAAPAPSVPWQEIDRLPVGERPAAIARLAEAANRDPNDPVARYHLGRAYQEAGQSADAVAALTQSLASGARLPRTLQGWALIRLGTAAEVEGRRSDADSWYRRAAQLKGFVFRRVAEDRLKYPGNHSPPEG